LWTARVLNAVGWYHSHLKDYDQAERLCRQALELCRRHGFLELESYVWHSIGVNHFNAGRHRQALTYLNACLERGRLVDSWLIEPTCLLFVGNAHLALGERRAARQAWLRARQILRSQHRLEEVGQAEAKLRLLSQPFAG
jgi:tetratricopeptide (TPR) repeat protein